MSESLQPLASGERPWRYVPNSLMSGATAHTVNPLLGRPSSPSAPRPARHGRVQLMALVAISAGFGLAGAAGISKLRERPAPIMQIVSGSPLLKKSSDGEAVRWHSARSKIYFDNSIEAAGAQAREAVQLGFGTWLQSGAKLPQVEFDSTKGARFGQVPNGKSEVMYGAITLPGHEKDLALTVTFSDPKTGEVLESDMIFNDRYTYGVLPDGAKQRPDKDENGSRPELEEAQCQQRYDLQSVATHEVGHFFGLGEDFDMKPATMYYTTGRCETHKRVLQGSDETTMAALYASADSNASPNDDPSAKGCGGARIGQGQTGGATPLFALFGVLGFVAMRRARVRSRASRL